MYGYVRSDTSKVHRMVGDGTPLTLCALVAEAQTDTPAAHLTPCQRCESRHARREQQPKTHSLAIVNSSRKGIMVHRAGCRDLARLNPFFETVWTEEHDSVQSVVESVYADMMPEDQQPWTYYEPEFRFFPCCPPLPRESVPEA